mgnify:CR=1 FL=1
MTYDNPNASAEWMRAEFFNMYLVALTKLGKPVKAQELNDVLKLSQQMASKCIEIVKNDICVKASDEATKFWNDVQSKL